MKRLLVPCLSFLGPVALFGAVLATSPVTAQDAPKKKGGDPPTVLYCDIGDNKGPGQITIDDGDVAAAVQACLAAGGHPVGVN